MGSIGYFFQTCKHGLFKHDHFLKKNYARLMAVVCCVHHNQQSLLSCADAGTFESNTDELIASSGTLL